MNLLLALLLLLSLGACTAPRRASGGNCTFNDDCTSPLVCAGGFCREACSTDRDCPAGATCRASDSAGRSVCLGPTAEPLCTTHADCNGPDAGATRLCIAHRCVEQCRSTADCDARFGPGLQCDLERSSSTFGACVPARVTMDAGCPEGGAACGSSCVDLQRDARHCGSCDTDCTTLPNVDGARVACVGGRCAVEAACTAGHAHCSREPREGCEADLSRATSCGACGNVCTAARPVCLSSAMDAGTGYACAASCPAPSIACGGSCVDPQSDPSHCGACGRTCAAGPNMQGRCNAGACAASCLAGYGDCDGDASNGCETDLRSTASHCGACATACPSGPGGTAACNRGACALSCDRGLADCDGNSANGCEANLQSDGANCGFCGNACVAGGGATSSCSAGVCGLRCAAGTGDCDRDPSNGCESNTAGDPEHCGLCSTVCPSGANAARTCAMGACGLACNAGYGDCDRNAFNGCEAPLQGSVSDCGACGNRCAAPANASATCAAGRCGFLCGAGFADCDGDPSNGCEVSLDADPAHCGSCANACPSRAGTVSTCAGGSCSSRCAPGLADCDGVSANGCEANLGTSVSSCGACGVTCGGANASASCAGGRCSLACNAGFADCDGNSANGCETNLQTDAAHCGSCAGRCTPAGPGYLAACASGSCAQSCAPGFLSVGTECLRPPPRLLAPLSGVTSTSTTVNLSVRTLAGLDQVDVQLCRDAACASSVAMLGGMGAVFTPPLAPGAYFWRARYSAQGGAAAGAWTAPWEFWVRAQPTGRPPPAATAWYLAPDFDRDGAHDLAAVGNSSTAPNGPVVALFPGRAGGPNATPSQAIPLTGLSNPSVSMAGDVNGDGFGDFVVVSSVSCGGATGRLDVFFGSAAGLVSTAVTVCVPASSGALTVAHAGDMDGDGYGDVAVGPCGTLPNSTVCFLRGGPSGLQPAVQLAPPAGFQGAGYVLHSAGDMDGDGLGDLFVSSCTRGGGI